MSEEKKSPKNIYWIAGISAATVIVIAIAWFLTRGQKGTSTFSFPGRDTSGDAPQQIVTKTTNDLQVTDFTLQPRQGEQPASVTGTLVNQGKKDYGMPIVSFSGTEASGGASLDTCLALKNDAIAPGESWEFTAVCGQNMNPASVQLIEINYTEVK